MILIQPAYKIVQVYRDRMFSVNPLSSSIRKFIETQKDEGEIVEYQINHQTFPCPNGYATLFVCGTFQK